MFVNPNTVFLCNSLMEIHKDMLIIGDYARGKLTEDFTKFDVPVIVTSDRNVLTTLPVLVQKRIFHKKKSVLSPTLTLVAAQFEDEVKERDLSFGGYLPDDLVPSFDDSIYIGDVTHGIPISVENAESIYKFSADKMDFYIAIVNNIEKYAGEALSSWDTFNSNKVVLNKTGCMSFWDIAIENAKKKIVEWTDSTLDMDKGMSLIRDYEWINNSPKATKPRDKKVMKVKLRDMIDGLQGPITLQDVQNFYSQQAQAITSFNMPVPGSVLHDLGNPVPVAFEPGELAAMEH